MSLSQDPTFSMLKSEFICGYRDISKEKYAGLSNSHETCGAAVDTTNGAGPHNIQIFVLNSDGIVLTCLPGYWSSKDLASELTLAEKLNEVWQDPQLTHAQKNQLFEGLQLAHINQHTQAEHERSRIQGFDVAFEKKERPNRSDIFVRSNAAGAAGAQETKPVDILMHERMSRQPFVAYADFQVAQFCDYGRPMYDKNEQWMATGSRVPQTKIGNYHPWRAKLESLGSSR